MGRRRQRAPRDARERREKREKKRAERAERAASERSPFETQPQQEEEVAICAGLRLPDMTRDECEESLDELAALARASGARVAALELQSRARVDGRTFLGTGKAEELKDTARRLGANLILVDHDLSPAQARNGKP